MDKLYKYINNSGIQITKAAEVGVLSIETSTLKAFLDGGVICDFYEAVPEFCAQIERSLIGKSNARLFCHAVSDFDGSMDLCMAGPSTFAANQQVSPALNHDGYVKDEKKIISVKVVDFLEVDPGDYDLVTIDVEGGEYSVLRRMKSRPLVISIETQSRDYVNPHIGAITDWMVENDYKIWFQNDTDTVFYKGFESRLGLVERIKTRWHCRKYFSGRL
jgi:FkbM family methyltransferase